MRFRKGKTMMRGRQIGTWLTEARIAEQRKAAANREVLARPEKRDIAGIKLFEQYARFEEVADEEQREQIRGELPTPKGVGFLGLRSPLFQGSLMDV